MARGSSSEEREAVLRPFPDGRWPGAMRGFRKGPRWPAITWGLLAWISALGCAASGSSEAARLPPVAAYQGGQVQAEHAATGHDEADAGHEGHEAHGKGTQALNFFAGGSRETGDKDGLTFGLDYEYRLSEPLGIGAFAEGVTGLDRSFATGLQLYWHAVGDLVLVAGPGLERHHDEWRPLARLGGFYEIPLGGGWVISPAFFYDIAEGENFWLYGLNIGFLW